MKTISRNENKKLKSNFNMNIKFLKLLLLLAFMFNINTLFAQDNFYTSGYYFDKSGNKIEGLISHFSCTMIKFKENNNSKSKRIYSKDVLGFHTLGKNFKVVQNISIKSRMVLFPSKEDFAFVEIVREGKVNLYIVKIFVNNGMTYGSGYYYLIEKDNNIQQIYRAPRRFRKQISEILSDNQLLLQEIINEKLAYNDIVRIVEKYNK